MKHSECFWSLRVWGVLGEVLVLHLSGATGFDSEGDRVVGLNKHSSVLFKPSKENHKKLQLKTGNQFYGTLPLIVCAQSSEVMQTPDCWTKDKSKISFGPWMCHHFFLHRFLGNFNLCHWALFCRLVWPWLSECGGLLAIIPVPSQKKHSRKSAQMVLPFPPFSQLIFGC